MPSIAALGCSCCDAPHHADNPAPLRHHIRRLSRRIAFPWETQSDSFYFVGNELIMHNKAQYAYTPPPE